MHYDMDAFYASIEINRNPKLKNKPIVVMSRVTLASAPIMMMNDVSAENPWVTAIPVSTILSVVPPASRDSSRVSAKAPSDPTNAPAEKLMTPPPRPAIKSLL